MTDEDAIALINQLVTHICQLYRAHDPAAGELYACLDAALRHVTSVKRIEEERTHTPCETH